jgi:CRP-like cAMP-binding protein
MYITPLVRAIAAHPPAEAFRPHLDDAQWRRLGEVLQRRTLAAGELLIQRGQTEAVAHVLESGELQVFVTGGPPGSHRISVLRAGAIVGEPGLFGSAPRMAHVEALGPCVVWTLSGDRLLGLAGSDPRLVIEVLAAAGRVMAERMRANLARGIPVS